MAKPSERDLATGPGRRDDPDRGPRIARGPLGTDRRFIRSGIALVKATRERLSTEPEKCGRPLRGDLKGLWKLRVGEFRAIYEIHKEQVVVYVIKVGLRRNDDVYRAAFHRGLLQAALSVRRGTGSGPVGLYPSRDRPGRRKFTLGTPSSTGMVINELRVNPDHHCFGHVLTRGGYETG